jgi:hypothetical protein
MIETEGGKTRRRHSLSLALLFAATAALWGGGQALAPATAGAYNVECSWQNDVFVCGEIQGGDNHKSGADCYGHCWDSGGVPGSDGGANPESGKPPRVQAGEVIYVEGQAPSTCGDEPWACYPIFTSTGRKTPRLADFGFVGPRQPWVPEVGPRAATVAEIKVCDELWAKVTVLVGDADVRVIWRITRHLMQRLSTLTPSQARSVKLLYEELRDLLTKWPRNKCSTVIWGQKFPVPDPDETRPSGRKIKP